MEINRNTTLNPSARTFPKRVDADVQQVGPLQPLEGLWGHLVRRELLHDQLEGEPTR